MCKINRPLQLTVRFEPFVLVLGIRYDRIEHALFFHVPCLSLRVARRLNFGTPPIEWCDAHKRYACPCMRG